MKKSPGLHPEYIVAIFLASMFGSLILTLLMSHAVEPGVPLPLLPRVLLTAAAIIIYAVVVWLTFYIVVPQWRPALRGLVNNRSR
jgi:hypothetical protein